MLTIFSTFKPFSGHSGVIQRNAARSWAQLRPSPEILLFGDSEGTAELAAEIGARHLPEIRCSRRGTPLISDMFARAAEAALHDTLCYVNGDIILGKELLAAIRRISLPQYMMVGRRTELEVTEPLDFSGPWRDELDRKAASEGFLQRGVAIDYFVMPRELASRLKMPDFAIGRPRWDNWTLYRVRQLGVPLVDATEVVPALHQNHDYGHLRGGLEEYRRQGRDNLELAGGKRQLFFIRDATHRLTPKGLVRNLRTPLTRRLETLAALRPRVARPLRLVSRWLALPARLLGRSDG